MLPEENKKFLEDPEIPLYQKILNLDAGRWERSKYLNHSPGSEGAHRLKDLGIIRQLAPKMYEAAAEDVKAFKDSAVKHNGTWKKLGSIPAIDMELHPELRYDKTAQDKYFMEHPELRTNG